MECFRGSEANLGSQRRVWFLEEGVDFCDEFLSFRAFFVDRVKLDSTESLFNEFDAAFLIRVRVVRLPATRCYALILKVTRE